MRVRPFCLKVRCQPGLGAAGPLERRRGAFEKGADVGDLAQGLIAGFGVAVGQDGAAFHINKIYYLLIMASAKAFPKKKNEHVTPPQSQNLKVGSLKEPLYSTRRMGNSEQPVNAPPKPTVGRSGAEVGCRILMQVKPGYPPHVREGFEVLRLGLLYSLTAARRGITLPII